MKHTATLSLTFAFVSVALLGSQFAHARTNGSMSSIADDGAMQEATLMVPAEAALVQDLDASKIQPGNSFEARLSDGVRLKNGPALPRGTVLMGTVEANQTGASGASDLVLRFTSAKLRNGTSVPIKATIVGMAKPTLDGAGLVVPPVNTWNSQTLQVEQVGVLPGIDLHSNIASPDSGKLDGNGTDHLRLGRDIQISLAIAAQGNS